MQILPYCHIAASMDFFLLFNFFLFLFFLSELSIHWCRWILVSAGSVPNRGHCPGLDLHSCPHVGGKVGSDNIISLIVYHYIWIYEYEYEYEYEYIWIYEYTLLYKYNIIWYDMITFDYIWINSLVLISVVRWAMIVFISLNYSGWKMRPHRN